MAGLLDGTEVYIVPSSGPEIPLEFMAAVTIEMSRGCDADALKFLTSDDRFSSIGAGPCTLRFKTPVDFGKGSKTLDWKGWYMASIQPNSQRPGSFIVTMYDYRFLAAKNKVTVSYNIEWPDTKLREESKTAAGDRLWYCLDAAIDTLTKFGFQVDDYSKHLVNVTQRAKVLPMNLGNTPGGGWAAASLDEIIPALLEPIRCDLVMTPEGKARIVSRSGFDDSPKLEAHSLIAGVVGERNIKWQKPSQIRVQFERLVEGVFEYTSYQGQGSLVRGQDINFQVVNVMPEYKSDKTTGEYVELQQQVFDRYGPFSFQGVVSGNSADRYIGSRYFKPHMFPYRRDPKTRLPIGNSPAEIARDIAIRSWFDDNVKQCWHRLFRVEPKAFSSVSYARFFTNIRLGRLEKNGGTKDGGNVYCNYVKHLKWGVLPPDAKSISPLNNVFSENHTFGDPANTAQDGTLSYSYNPAPFIARWVSAEKLIFEVAPQKPSDTNTKSFFPGTMVERLNYGPLFQLASGSALKVTEVSGKIAPDFTMRVIWNGRVSRDLPNLSGEGFTTVSGARLAEVVVDAFSDGMGPDVVVRADPSITANYAITETGLKRPINGSLMSDVGQYRTLLNKDEVEDTAEFIAAQVMQTYNQNRAGVATCLGISAMSAGIWTGGLIHKASIVIGQDMNESVMVNYIVQPEVRDIETRREKPSKAPRLAVEE